MKYSFAKNIVVNLQSLYSTLQVTAVSNYHQRRDFESVAQSYLTSLRHHSVAENPKQEKKLLNDLKQIISEIYQDQILEEVSRWEENRGSFKPQISVHLWQPGFELIEKQLAAISAYCSMRGAEVISQEETLLLVLGVLEDLIAEKSLEDDFSRSAGKDFAFNGMFLSAYAFMENALKELGRSELGGRWWDKSDALTSLKRLSNALPSLSAIGQQEIQLYAAELVNRRNGILHQDPLMEGARSTLPSVRKMRSEEKGPSSQILHLTKKMAKLRTIRDERWMVSESILKDLVDSTVIITISVLLHESKDLSKNSDFHQDLIYFLEKVLATAEPRAHFAIVQIIFEYLSQNKNEDFEYPIDFYLHAIHARGRIHLVSNSNGPKRIFVPPEETLDPKTIADYLILLAWSGSEEMSFILFLDMFRQDSVDEQVATSHHLMTSEIYRSVRRSEVWLEVEPILQEAHSRCLASQCVFGELRNPVCHFVNEDATMTTSITLRHKDQVLPSPDENQIHLNFPLNSLFKLMLLYVSCLEELAERFMDLGLSENDLINEDENGILVDGIYIQECKSLMAEILASDKPLISELNGQQDLERCDTYQKIVVRCGVLVSELNKKWLILNHGFEPSQGEREEALGEVFLEFGYSWSGMQDLAAEAANEIYIARTHMEARLLLE